MLTRIVNGEEIIISSDEEAEIEASWIQNTIDKQAKQYIEDRQKAYPSVQDQLDMLYKDMVNNTTEWVDSISTIKATYPKPAPK